MSLDGARVPPQNLAAERSVLGCLLLDNRTIDDVVDSLQPNHFYSDIHQEIYAAILALHKQELAADAVTVAEQIGPRLDSCGGAEYLLEILDTVPHTAHIAEYTKIVKDRWIQRNLTDLSLATIRDCQDGGIDVEDTLAKTERGLAALSTGNAVESAVPVADSLLETLDAIGNGRVPRIRCGISTVDEIIGGFREGHLILVAGRTSMGKSALCVNFAHMMAEAGTPVHIISLEMSRSEIDLRLLSRVCGMSARDIEEVSDQKTLSRISEAANMISFLPIYVDDSSRSLNEVLKSIRFAVKKWKAKVVVVDYVGNIMPTDPRMPVNQQIGEATKALKAIAGKLKISIILAAQINREAEKTESRRPRISHLRDSGSLEQDADMVLLVYRAGYYDLNEPQDKAEIIVAKHRMGATGVAMARWDGRTTTFRDPVMAVSDTEYESWV